MSNLMQVIKSLIFQYLHMGTGLAKAEIRPKNFFKILLKLYTNPLNLLKKKCYYL
jgi:hypothetical protein